MGWIVVPGGSVQQTISDILSKANTVTAASNADRVFPGYSLQTRPNEIGPGPNLIKAPRHGTRGRQMQGWYKVNKTLRQNQNRIL